MITLTVTSLNGVPGNGSLTAQFDELGGTIGRADTNQLVLPDPDRAISRVHAQVVYRSGSYAIVDRGSNPILVNGQPVGSGREVPIREGDKVQIGGFLLEVRQQAAASAQAASRGVDDPFADLLGPGAAAKAPAGPQGSAALFDPLAAFGDSRQADLAPPQRPPSAAPAAASSAASSAASGIPADWDPFAPDPVKPRSSTADFAQSLGHPAGQFGLDSGAAAPAALIPDLPSSGPGNDNSLDALFGLQPGSGGDPLANSRLDAPMAAPNMAASHDPLKSLSSAPLASAQSAQDDGSDLHRAFIPPPAADRLATPTSAPTPATTRTSATSAATTPASAPAAPASPATPAGAVLSWDAPETQGRTVIRPAVRAVSVAAPAPSTDAAAPDLFAGLASSPVTTDPLGGFAPEAAAVAPPPAPLQAPAMPSSADQAGLLAALIEGLDVPGLKLDRLTPELMRLIGQLLHESARGTVDLLVARAALKREVKAVGTMIVAQKNNPLKFSPSADVALQHLLSPPMRGFMDAAPAMRDAYDDLRAHQFGFIAGMKAALAGVIDRFKPSELEGRLAQRSGLRSLLPGSRKAAMWDLFTEHYAQISTEAEDDFHSLFGEAFLKAYEEHIAALQKDSP